MIISVSILLCNKVAGVYIPISVPPVVLLYPLNRLIKLGFISLFLFSRLYLIIHSISLSDITFISLSEPVFNWAFEEPNSGYGLFSFSGTSSSK